MKIYKRTEYSDKEIPSEIRRFGIRKTARYLKLSPSFMYGVLKNRQALREDYYLKLKDLLLKAKNEKNEIEGAERRK